MRALFRHPRALLVAMTLLVLGVGHRALFIPLDNSPETFFAADAEARARYRALVQTFGSDEVVLVDLLGAELGRADDLQAVVRLAREVEALPGVRGVFSVAPVVEGNAADPLAEIDEMELEAIAAEVQALPLFRKMGVVRPAAPALAVAATVVMQGTGARSRFNEALAPVLARFTTPRVTASAAGLATTNAAFDRETRRALLMFMPAVVLLSVLVGLALFRSLRAVVAIFFPVAGAVGIGVAGLELAGESLNLVTAVLPPLVLAIGFAGAIHLVSHYAALREDERLEPEEAARRTIQEKFMPTAFAFGTTAVGFGSLAISGVHSVTALGLGAAATLLVTLLLVTVGTPSFLLVLRPEIHAPAHRRRLLASLARQVLRRRPVVLTGALVFFGALGAGVPRVTASINGTKLLPEDSSERQAYERLEREGVGLGNLDLWLHLPQRDDATLLDAARRLRRLAERVEALPQVTGAVGVHDLLEGINYRASGAATVPITLAGLSLLEPAQRAAVLRSLDLFRNPEGGLKLTVLTLTADAEAEVSSVKQTILAAAAELFPGVPAEITGHYAMLIDTPGSLMNTLIESLAGSVVVVALLFLLLLRSPGLMLAGMVSNLLPVVAALGAMGWLGISMDVATVMMGSVAFGVAVDDTFHYLYHRRKSGSIARAAAITGQGIVATTVVICCGFLALGLSGFTPVVRFGLLTGFAAIVALAVDALLLPALVGRRSELD